MNALLKQLRRLALEELLSVSEAIDVELERRHEVDDPIPESSRRRAVQRAQSYRQSTGSSALPVKVAGMRDRDKQKRRKAA